MGVLTRLRRWWARVTGDPSTSDATGDGGRARGDEATAGRDDRGADAFDFDPDAIQSRTDILDETGHTPREFAVHLLEAEGGRLPQQALTEYTALSEAAISRYLQELEDDDIVVRLELGREKVVFLPEQAPSPSTGGESPDGAARTE